MSVNISEMTGPYMVRISKKYVPIRSRHIWYVHGTYFWVRIGTYWVRISGRIWARTGTYICTDRYVFQCVYLLTMARIWHVQVRIWHVQWHVSGTVLGTYIAVQFRSDSTAGSCSVRCSSTTGLLSLIESSTGVCTQVPTCHSLLQQPAASAPRPATRPASATKQQQPPVWAPARFNKPYRFSFGLGFQGQL